MDPITVQSYPLTKTGKPSTGATLTLTRERARLGCRRSQRPRPRPHHHCCRHGRAGHARLLALREP